MSSIYLIYCIKSLPCYTKTTNGRDELTAYRDQRFFEGTRGKVVTLLRRGGRTVEELAQALNLTDNGVRAHLATLERDGIVRQRGSVRRGSGGGKPAYVYELTPEGEELFPKAYEPVLRSVGRRIAEGQSVPADGVRGRLEAAADVLNELGGLAELEEERNGSFVIRGYSCPLAGVVADHPEVCRMAETLLTELAGVPVYERCERCGRGE